MSVSYDYPNNELIRVCLRIEHLYEGIEYFLQGTHHFDHHTCLSLIIDSLNLLDRPDLRSKFAQEISRQHASLSRLAQTPEVDHAKLTDVIKDLEANLQRLHGESGKFADDLRHNEFIYSIRQQHAIPGGTCSFSTPGYHLWLQQSHQMRADHLESWLQALSDIYTISQSVLRLVRNSAMLKAEVAQSGFYQTSLDPQTSWQLIRVVLPAEYTVFPRFSIGRHGLSIRFLEASLHDRAQKTDTDIQFDLACCR